MNYGEEVKDVAVVKSSAAPQTQEDRLLEKVLDSGNIEVLERYIALRKSEEERQARIAFEEHFAQLRADLKPIIKRRENTWLKSKYAALEDLQNACDELIAKYHFFYTFREEAIPGGKRIWMDISGYGHTRSNYFDTPDMDVMKSNEGKTTANILQVRGIQSSYGQRYAFKAGFGIVIAGEDSDGVVTLKDSMRLANEIAEIKNAKSPDQLRDVWARLYKAFANDPAAQKILAAAKDEAKAALK